MVDNSFQDLGKEIRLTIPTALHLEIPPTITTECLQTISIGIQGHLFYQNFVRLLLETILQQFLDFFLKVIYL